MKHGKHASEAEKPLSARQRALIAVIQTLDPDLRHTLHIECRGSEPWNVTTVKEHLNIRLDAGPKTST